MIKEQATISHPTVIPSPVVDILSDNKILNLAADKDQIDCYATPIENGAFVGQQQPACFLLGKD